MSSLPSTCMFSMTLWSFHQPRLHPVCRTAFAPSCCYLFPHVPLCVVKWIKPSFALPPLGQVLFILHSAHTESDIWVLTTKKSRMLLFYPGHNKYALPLFARSPAPPCYCTITPFVQLCGPSSAGCSREPPSFYSITRWRWSWWPAATQVTATTRSSE